MEQTWVPIVGTLERHVADCFGKIDKTIFLRQLDSCHPRALFDEFYYPLHGPMSNAAPLQVICKENAQRALCMNYAIRNDQVPEHVMTRFEAGIYSLLSKIGIKYLTPEICSILSSPSLTYLMQLSTVISLLGECTTTFYDRRSNLLHIKKQPVLVVPGEEYHDAIRVWESVNAQCYREARNSYLKGFEKISSGDFPSARANELFANAGVE